VSHYLTAVLQNM